MFVDKRKGNLNDDQWRKKLSVTDTTQIAAIVKDTSAISDFNIVLLCRRKITKDQTPTAFVVFF